MRVSKHLRATPGRRDPVVDISPAGGGLASRLAFLLEAGPELPWSDWAMEPAGLGAVCHQVAEGKRAELLECGSGISTIVLARLLRELGAGRLRSLEHDPDWAAWVRSQLAAEGLSELARVIDAPLREHPLAREGARWYAPATLAELPRAGIDLLLVDGPPTNLPGMEEGRYPALPALRDRLSPAALVVLDDAERPGERAVLDAWERETDFRFQRVAPGRIAIGRRAR